ncbi:MAG: reverse gyrase [Thermoplasmata archaeon]
MSLEHIPESIFLKSCPNCGNDIKSIRLYHGSVCDACLPGEKEYENLYELVENLHILGKLKNLSWTEKTFEMVNEYEKLFRGTLGFLPSGIQRAWIVRLSRDQSFGISAPTGFGKTTFGILSSLYYSTKGQKSILVFQSRTLLDQSRKILRDYANKLNMDVKIISVSSGMKKSEREMNENNFYEGNFDIGVFTGRYVMNNADKMSKLNYNFIFVDDIDSAIKTKKGAYSILKVLGFDEGDISNIQEILKLEDDERYRKLQNVREKKLKDRKVIFSSATISGGNRILTSILGFRPGSISVYLRNIVDYKERLDESITRILELVKIMKDGIIIYVSPEYGIEKAEEISEFLNKNGIKSLTVTSKSVKGIEEFTEGKINVLIGMSSYNGLLVRGIDIPWRIKYTLFYGIPKFAIKEGETLPFQYMVRILAMISKVTGDQGIKNLYTKLNKMMKNITPGAFMVLQKRIEEGKADEEIKMAYDIVKEYLKNESFLEYINRQTNYVFDNGWLKIPSHITYIHATGRTSRMFRGILTRGISIVLYENENLMKKFENKLRSLSDIEFKELDKVNFGEFEKNIQEVETERLSLKEGMERNVTSVLSGMKHILLIVESPIKARTITSFFGKPGFFEVGGIRVYETFLGNITMMIAASQGHLYDLTTRPYGFYGVEKIHDGLKNRFIPYYSSIKRCRNGHQFTEPVRNRCPKCGEEIVMDKSNMIDDIRKLAFEVDEILIGSDPDTEGEKIAWDLFLNLRTVNKNIKRIEFHEVTKEAILNALKNPREMDISRIKAQIVRRIEDRWVGFALSRKMQTAFWKFYCKKLGLSDKINCKINRNLSAGRVQTPVLGWIVERTKEYYKHRKMTTLMKIEGLDKISFIAEDEINEPLKAKLKSTEYKIYDLKILPPYTTDTLLSDASHILKFDVGKTMQLAQELYELGFITYHRTDSTHVSDHGIEIVRSYFRQISENGEFQNFHPRKWSESGTHECIRPTRPLDMEMLIEAIESGEILYGGKITKDHLLLYNMIFKRFITSQLDNVKYEEESITIESEVNGKSIEMRNMEKSIVSVKLDDIPQNILKRFVYTPLPLKEASGEQIKKLCMNECILHPVWNIYISDINPYTEGDVVKEMREKRIGRPSTYSVIITNLKSRKYIIRDRNGYLYSTNLGEEGYAYLVNNFSHLVSETRTAKLYEEIDEIENGRRDYTETLNEIFDEISSSLKKEISYRYYEI